MNPVTKISASAVVEPSALLSSGVTVWANAHIREKSSIGSNTIIGENVYIGAGVVVGTDCKIQNNALVYEHSFVGDGVIGPGVILTNDHNPRAVTQDGKLKSNEDWIASGVEIGQGASIGAGAICIAPAKIGAWAMVAAGAVVTKDVESHSLVLGVPARQIGWVGKAGYRLNEYGKLFECPKTGEIYEIVNGAMRLRGTK